MKIARFLSIDVAKLFFGLNQRPTFCLKNLNYYQCHEQCSVGDPKENHIQHSQGDFENVNPTFVSCWTILNSEDVVTANDWEIFRDERVIAIISTPEKIDKFFKSKLQRLLSKDGGVPFLYELQHGPVTYYEPEKIKKLNASEARDKAPFMKRVSFKNQREYRFAFEARNLETELENLTFYIGIDAERPKSKDWEFIEGIILNTAKLNGSKARDVSDILSGREQIHWNKLSIGDRDKIINLLRNNNSPSAEFDLQAGYVSGIAEENHPRSRI